jgi:hypothetical protein
MKDPQLYQALAAHPISENLSAEGVITQMRANHIWARNVDFEKMLTAPPGTVNDLHIRCILAPIIVCGGVAATYLTQPIGLSHFTNTLVHATDKFRSLKIKNAQATRLLLEIKNCHTNFGILPL